MIPLAIKTPYIGKEDNIKTDTILWLHSLKKKSNETDHLKLFFHKAIYTVYMMSWCLASLREAGIELCWTSGFYILDVSILPSTAYFKVFPMLLSINGNKADVETPGT